jgi:hypothetical protein
MLTIQSTCTPISFLCFIFVIFLSWYIFCKRGQILGVKKGKQTLQSWQPSIDTWWNVLSRLYSMSTCRLEVLSNAGLCFEARSTSHYWMFIACLRLSARFCVDDFLWFMMWSRLRHVIAVTQLGNRTKATRRHVCAFYYHPLMHVCSYMFCDDHVFSSHKAINSCDKYTSDVCRPAADLGVPYILLICTFMQIKFIAFHDQLAQVRVHKG